MATSVPVERLRALAEKFGLSTTVERDSAGLILPDDEEEKPTIMTSPDVGFVFGDGLEAGQGTLFVTAK